MRGNDRTRFCSHCRQNVFNISNLTRIEAEELIRQKDGQLCVRYFQRDDGTIVTKDCTSAAGHWRRRIAIAITLFFAILGSVFGWLIWNTRGEDRYDNWARRTEPFRTILDWIDPAPMVTIVVGEIYISPLPSGPVENNSDR